MGLDGAIQRLIVNGDVMDDLVILAKDSRGIKRYVGPPCNDDVDDPSPKCQNGGICRPYFRSYVCKCPSNFMGKNCEKGKNRVPKCNFYISSKDIFKFARFL